MPHSAHHVPSAVPLSGAAGPGGRCMNEEEKMKTLGEVVMENCLKLMKQPLDHEVLIGSSTKSTRDTMNTQRTNERIAMPASTLKQWADTHGPQPVSRISARLERFAGNTGDPETALAAAELCKLLRDTLPKKEQADDAASAG